MARDLNQCNFIGRLGQDPESKALPSGSMVCNLSIACSDDYKDKSGNEVKQTNWVRVVAFGKLAEIMGQYLTKGSQVYISGKQVTRKWQNNEGKDQYSTEIVANEMQMLGGKSQADVSLNNPTSAPQRQDDFDKDLPF